MKSNNPQNSIIENNIKLIDEIVKYGKKFSLEVTLEKFIRHFYKFVPVETMQDNSINELYDFALKSFEFTNKFKKNENHKIEISTSKFDKHSKNQEMTCIKLLNIDSPFLVDSVIEELSRRGYKTHSLIHPVFKIKRNVTGKLEDIFSCDTKNKFNEEEYEAESLIHIHITELLSKEKIKLIKTHLLNVLSHVKAAVSDWKTMLTNSQNIIKQHAFSSENLEFLSWIQHNNFTFLGYAEYETAAEGNLLIPNNNIDKNLGILVNPHEGIDALLLDNIYRIVNINPRKDVIVEIRKINKHSLIHRDTNLDAIFIKIYDENKNVSKVYAFLGLFTSVVYYQSATLIPIIKQKISNIIKKTGLSKVSYSGKEIITILESLPRDELFQMEEKELIDIAIGIVSLHASPKLKLHIRQDSVGQILSCIVFIPKERFGNDTTLKVQKLLLKEFGGNIIGNYTQVTNLRLAYIHVTIKTEQYEISQSGHIEKKLEQITSLWNDNLFNSLINAFGNSEGEDLFIKYRNAFPSAYKEKFSPEISAIRDIKIIEDKMHDSEIIFDLNYLENVHSLLQFNVYTKSSVIALSEIMPMLDEMGFEALDESIFSINTEVVPCHGNIGNANDEESKQIWIHSFQLNMENSKFSKLEEIKENVEIAFSKLWAKQMQVDKFNSLILFSNLNWRQVTLIRALSKYLAQINFQYSQNYIAEILTKHSEFSAMLIQMFYVKFDPELNSTMPKRLKEIDSIKKNINYYLKKVLNSAEDNVLKALLNLVEAILRTNFFQFKTDENDVIYISFKLNSSQINNIPSPAPLVEIFVYSPRFEAVHLRGGKVARGGLRWSDRVEDYRTEVLGLVKAQMAKNSVIVPVGSKGGFILKKDLSCSSREEFMHEGITCYKLFLSSMLDITDNIVNGKVSKPNQTICHDDDDPYLVVAADKGTATFSDIANSISESYGFWLGDAFASGGSAGYDHKKMGITAKGAWVSVQRHFREMGIDTQTEDFTVLAVGDMSGDVFGNGMLLSKHIKLIAAFNHLHIFIDPNPISEISFKERKRLFEMPRSSWSDYDKNLMSKGGAIFERSSKSLKISKEIQDLIYHSEMLDEDKKSELSPDELIKHLLKSEVDLFWNGGIGTYVKAESETNEQVGDKANDFIRINGNELNAKVVGEGGNLGFTQLGRIEYAKKSGRINTDAIDNSAGVDCSDHEVNIKIALQNALNDNKLNVKKRNKILEEMTDEVSDLVLRDNRLQTQIITFEEQDSPKALGMYSRLLHNLESSGNLDRALEFLPNDDEIKMRANKEVGLTRPEISVILAYSKIAVYNELINSNMPNDPYFESDLIKYFPVKLKKQFSEEIENHPLRKEIIATFVANSIVNRTGTHFFHLALEDTQFKGCDIARSYAISRDSFDVRDIWHKIESLDGKIKLEHQVELFLEVKKFLQKTILWNLRTHPHPLNVTEIINNSKDGIKELMSNFDKIITGDLKVIYNNKFTKFIEYGADVELAKKIASLKTLSASGDILQIVQETNMEVSYVAHIYFKLGTNFYFDWLRGSIDRLKNMDQYWQKLSVRTLKEDLHNQQKRLTMQIIKFKQNSPTQDPVNDWSTEHQKNVKNFENLINDLKSAEDIDFSMLIVASKRLETLVYL